MPLRVDEPRTISELVADAVTANEMGPDAVAGYVRGLGVFDEIPRLIQAIKALSAVGTELRAQTDQFSALADLFKTGGLR